MLGYWYVCIQYIHVYAYMHKDRHKKCGTSLNSYPQWLIYVSTSLIEFTENQSPSSKQDILKENPNSTILLYYCTGSGFYTQNSLVTKKIMTPHTCNPTTSEDEEGILA